ncbi:MAG: acyltransferase [Cyanobacteria bacterium J06621_3]
MKNSIEPNCQSSYHLISQSLPMMKGWAIIWIVAYHLMGNTKGYLNLDETMATLSKGELKNILEGVLDLLISAGSTGVNVFLVISGFGLTASWWKRHGSQGDYTIHLVDFWQKRVFRIFPLFWVAVVLSLLFYFIEPNFAPFGGEVWSAGIVSALGAVLATVSTLRNFIPDYYYFLNGAWWYIGLSLQLYLVFPFLVAKGLAWGWPKLLFRALLFSLAYRTVCTFLPATDVYRTIALAFFPARLFEFTFGMYLAMAFTLPHSHQKTPGNKLYQSIRALLFNPRFLIVNFCCFGSGLILKWLNQSSVGAIGGIFQEVPITIGLFCGLVCVLQSGCFKLPAAWPLRDVIHSAISETIRKGVGTIGKYSYGIYLTHMNIYLVLWPVGRVLVPSYWMRFLAIALLCFAIGIGFELGYGWLQRRSRLQISS